jgi:hypothetical protein
MSMFTERWVSLLGVSAAQQAALLGAEGLSCWDVLAADPPSLEFGYRFLTRDESDTKLAELQRVPNEGTGYFMLVCEVVPVIESVFGWFGFPKQAEGRWDGSVVFVHESWKFFEFLELEWEVLIVLLHEGKGASLPLHATTKLNPISYETIHQAGARALALDLERTKNEASKKRERKRK